jgi:hypothetical protein
MLVRRDTVDVDQNLQHLIYNNGQRTLIGGRHKRACWGTNTRHGENTEAHYPPVRLLGGGEPDFRRVIDLLPSLSSLSPTRLPVVPFPPLRSARCHGRVRIISPFRCSLYNRSPPLQSWQHCLRRRRWTVGMSDDGCNAAAQPTGG